MCSRSEKDKEGVRVCVCVCGGELKLGAFDLFSQASCKSPSAHGKLLPDIGKVKGHWSFSFMCFSDEVDYWLLIS